MALGSSRHRSSDRKKLVEKCEVGQIGNANMDRSEVADAIRQDPSELHGAKVYGDNLSWRCRATSDTIPSAEMD
uniref:Uncharacterized protein n=2 Tax=Oryza glumipatula TaxID=40148 RepID=A0A0D9ZHQ3_9ORYZ